MYFFLATVTILAATGDLRSPSGARWTARMSRSSIDYLGSRFCSFETNGLEVATLTFASWNQIAFC